MIHAKIIISEINYEKSFANLYPDGMKRLNEIEEPNRAVRFLKKMGDVSMAAALGVMDQMTEKGKGELLCALGNLYHEEIQAALKSYLEKNELGKNVQFGNIFLTQDSAGYLALFGYDIKVNYSGLAENAKVQDKIKDIAGNMVSGISKISWLKEAAADGAGFAAKAAAKIAPDEIEKLGISILEKPENKKKLLSWAAQVLSEKGLCLKLENCVFSQESNLIECGADSSEVKNIGFSEELEEELSNAVVRYLKVLLEE